MQDNNDEEADPRRTAQKRRGRPSFEPNDEKRRVVALMASGGLPQEQIARHFGISVPTLCKYFRPELLPAEEEQATDRHSDIRKRRTVADILARKRMRRLF